jgi:hypothetical protein
MEKNIMKGYIYILKNPSFRDFVKIGYADDVEERVKQLNSSECTPFAFRIYATYEVNSRLMDKKIHSIIDKLNPKLRSIDDYNGQKRVREFYAMSAEDAYSIFQAIAEINDCPEKLKKWETSVESISEEKIAEEVMEEANYQRQEKHANFTFDYWQIPVGSILENVEDSTIKCTVIDNRRVEYNGEIMYMTPLAKLLSGKQWLTNGPGWVAKNFKYNGELLVDIENRLY